MGVGETAANRQEDARIKWEVFSWSWHLCMILSEIWNKNKRHIGQITSIKLNGSMSHNSMEIWYNLQTTSHLSSYLGKEVLSAVTVFLLHMNRAFKGTIVGRVVIQRGEVTGSRYKQSTRTEEILRQRFFCTKTLGLTHHRRHVSWEAIEAETTRPSLVQPLPRSHTKLSTFS